LADIRNEAFDAWVKSKEEEVHTYTEKGLRTAYQEVKGRDGIERKPAGQKLQSVKEVVRRISRLPENQYLRTIVACLEQEMKLEGLTTDVTVNMTQNNLNVDGGFPWDSLCGRDEEPDRIEEKISRAALPPPPPGSEVIIGPPRGASEWTPAEIAEIEDTGEAQ
jgi:hypothetical protein